MKKLIIIALLMAAGCGSNAPTQPQSEGTAIHIPPNHANQARIVEITITADSLHTWGTVWQDITLRTDANESKLIEFTHNELPHVSVDTIYTQGAEILVAAMIWQPIEEDSFVEIILVVDGVEIRRVRDNYSAVMRERIG